MGWKLLGVHSLYLDVSCARGLELMKQRGIGKGERGVKETSVLEKLVQGGQRQALIRGCL